MKKLALWKSANDFAFANIGETNAVTLQASATKAFIDGGFDPLDLDLWNGIAKQQRQQFLQWQKQKLPSEVAEANKPKPEPAAAPAQS